MNNYLDPNDWGTAQLVEELNAAAQEMRVLQLIEKLKPTFSMDGNQFCFLYGEMPNDCVVGFGETAAKAMNDFANAFYNSKAVKEV